MGFSDYSPPYLYFLSLAALLPIRDLWLIKGLSIGFDFVMAFLAYRVTRCKYTRGPIPVTAFFADVVSIIYAAFFPRRILVPVAVLLASFFSYLPFLFGITVVPLGYLAIVLVGIVAWLIADVMRDLYPAKG